MARYSTNKHINQLVIDLVKQGWFFEKRKKHNSLCTPDRSKRIFFSCTPSDSRAYLNLRQDIRKTGFNTIH